MMCEIYVKEVKKDGFCAISNLKFTQNSCGMINDKSLFLYMVTNLGLFELTFH